MTTDTARATHFLVISYPSWAHTRSEIGLSVHLQQLNPNLYITLLIPARRSKAAAIELAQYPPVPGRRRVILHYGDETQSTGGMWNPQGGFREECMAQLAPLTDCLVERRPMIDPVTGESVTPHQIPYSLIIADVTLSAYGAELVKVIKQDEPSVEPLQVLGFGPYNTAFLAFLLLDKYEFVMRVRTIVESSGGDARKKDRLAEELISGNTDVMNVPGLWPFYMHESAPNVKEAPINRLDRFYAIGKAFPSWVDGMIMGWPHIFGRELQDDMATHFGALFQVGYTLPPAPTDEWAVEGEVGSCKSYLDRSPTRSVIYISFGSAIYAPTFDQMRILLDVLAELGSRYIMAEGNAPEEIREHMRARIGVGGDKGLLVPWAPQRAILCHPATAVFLTHGGSNSAMEAILHQVPMIQWPAGFDQPYIANEMDKMGVARELIQIRGGLNVGKPIARNGTVVQGTEQALRQEFISLFGDLDGEWIRDIRKRLDVACETIKQDREVGASYGNVRKLAYMGSVDRT